ncbi:hypothetical protein KOR42_48010 [Thalassoglobus neptunius]|uniref:Uncharacterized protein n=2 Tax=Thalassoglobus neptunius TaxID=1938619 RepID=A0A5C5VS63_9PLAN|nr:hypothetical protein KOR42_48010 [Thalassoglobus neptunius]
MTEERVPFETKFANEPLSFVDYWAYEKLEKDHGLLNDLCDRWWEEAQKVTYLGDLCGYSWADTPTLRNIAEIVIKFSLKSFPQVNCQPLFAFWFACTQWEADKESRGIFLEFASIEYGRSVAALATLRFAAGVKRGVTNSNSRPRPFAKKTVDEQLAALWATNHEARNWTAKRIARELECDDSSVKKSKAWKRMRKTVRFEKEEARERFSGELWDSQD